MSRFDFYEREESRRVARYVSDRLSTLLEEYHANRSFGLLTIVVEFRDGEVYEVGVTPQVTVRAANLVAADE